MARNRNLLNKRNQLIFNRYKELASKSINDKRLYTYDAILAMISEEFWLSSDYISKLILTMKSNHKSEV